MDTLLAKWRALTPNQKKQLAAALNSSVPSLSQVFNRHIRPGANFALRLEAVAPWAKRHLLRPDIWPGKN